ncbi:hypothetical protein PHMEG_00040695 [Phytophthora megakarya]|uniref:Uncharacterized protein n=1 Tax=Phytophthora megakarya TaxID=4795 RepID=A0A225UFP0_9STRA|nr:hypothetical protein PHMEG_00040695 [Phytophthora megakarya]
MGGSLRVDGGTIQFLKTGTLPASHASPQGYANIKPTRAVITPKRDLDVASFVVGVSTHSAACRSDTHVQDSYGQVENLLVFDGLSNQDLDDLALIVGSQSEVRNMVIRICPGPDDQPLESFEAFLDMLLVRRQMASVFRQFESERFGELLFYSVSLLHRAWPITGLPCPNTPQLGFPFKILRCAPSMTVLPAIMVSSRHITNRNESRCRRPSTTAKPNWTVSCPWRLTSGLYASLV